MGIFHESNWASRGSAPAAHRYGSRAGSHIRGEISPEGSTMDVPLRAMPCLLHNLWMIFTYQFTYAKW
jgi:hypothetical protein